jgi:hypothetical protein
MGIGGGFGFLSSAAQAIDAGMGLSQVLGSALAGAGILGTHQVFWGHITNY